jgi:hypothetical protein
VLTSASTYATNHLTLRVRIKCKTITRIVCGKEQQRERLNRPLLLRTSKIPASMLSKYTRSIHVEIGIEYHLSGFVLPDILNKCHIRYASMISKDVAQQNGRRWTLDQNM